MKRFILATLLLFAFPAFAQNIETGHDSIPNFAAQPTITSASSGDWSNLATWDCLCVPQPGDIVTVLPLHAVDVATADVSVIGVQRDGSLRLTDGFSLKVQTILLMPGSAMTGGTLAAPISGEAIIKNQPIDRVLDPFQYGNGIVAIDATVKLYGYTKTPWLRLTAEPHANDVALPISTSGWRAGDKLVIPDSREVGSGQHDTPIVGAVSAGNITLATALQYDHPGAEPFLPHVGNLSRSIVIRSENPLGTRGHTLFTGHSTVDVQYVEFSELGRTKASVLHNTLADSEGNITRLGTNDVGEYPIHCHHVVGGCKLIGNAIDGSPKWAIAIHNSHYGLIKDNVVYNAIGSGIAMEDGSETGNVVDGNFVTRSDGSGRSITDGLELTDNGHEGSAFWMRAQDNTYINNVAADCRFAGFMIFERFGHVGKTGFRAIPLHADSDVHDPAQSQSFDIRQSVSPRFENNETYGCRTGYEYWYAWNSIAKDSASWNQSSMHAFYQYHGTAIMDGFRAVGSAAVSEAIVGQHGTHLQLRHAEVENVLRLLRIEPNKKGIEIEDVTVDGNVVPDTPAKPITVSIDLAAESTVSGVVTITATVTPATAGKVEMAVDGKLLKAVKNQPRTFTWPTTKTVAGEVIDLVADGPHMVVVNFADQAYSSQRVFVGN